MDGLTFSVNADTSTGHFEVYDYNTDLDEDTETFNSPSSKSNKFDTDVDTFDKEQLRYENMIRAFLN